MDATVITAAVTGLRFAYDSLKTLAGMKVDTEVLNRILAAQEKVGAVQDALYDMRDELFRLQTENEALKREKTAADAWNTRAAKYELTQTQGGAIVYKFSGAPLHYACPSCWNQHRVEPLQDNRTLSGKYRCTSCKAEYPVDPRGEMPDLNVQYERPF